MIGLLMQKIATTNMYSGAKFHQVTVLKAQCPKVLRIINTETYYQAILGFFTLEQKNEHRYNKSFLNGCYQDKESRRRIVKSFTVPQPLMKRYSNIISAVETAYSNGGNIGIKNIFSEGSFVNSQAIVKGRGFSGGMRRHNFDGLRATHGVSVSHRSIGSTGCRKPSRVIKGRKMPGRYGGNLTTIKNLLVVKIDCENGLMVIKGSVPGHKDALVRVVPNF